MRRCKYCRTPLVRKIRASGPESAHDFATRVYCDLSCRNSHAKPRQPSNHPWILAGINTRRRRVRLIAERIAALRTVPVAGDPDAAR